MQYMLMIYRSEAVEPAPDTSEFGELMNNFSKFTNELRDKNKLVGFGALGKIESSTTVQVRQGKTITLDGPFAETKEQFGGYYIVDCEHLDEAIEYASKIPFAKLGSIEIRPLVPLDL